MKATTFFVLYLITLPDIESDNHLMSRLAFDDREACMYLADKLNQRYDPWVRKPNCVEVEQFYLEVRVPLPKPKEMP